MINSDACNKDIKVEMIKDRTTGLNNLKLVTYLMHLPPSFSPVLLRHSLPLAISQYYINHNTAPCPILQIPLAFFLSPDMVLNQRKKEVRQRVWPWGHSWKKRKDDRKGGPQAARKGWGPCRL